MDLLQMRWRDALFAHWPVDPAVVSARLPEGLRVATYDGDAWLGVVGFVMADIRPCGAPLGLSFPELNLRTYVTRPGSDDHGVYFFSLDADDRLGVSVARRFFELPYYRAELRVDRTEGDDGPELTLRHRRTHPDVPPARFVGTYRPVGPESVPEAGSLEAFLTENYRFYTAGGGRLYYGDIDHPPWPLAPAEAEIESNTLFAANGFEAPEGEPLVHYSPGTEVTAGPLRRI
ncbi:YqjF family protein [Halobellus rubicundus]|uniref:YqjF family protein n=1 Tax=Halobellus rubicundus TaxID=2996466 RepID=A0ABD5MB40_9EURY